jgi:ATP-dependent protease ClpP protease subunit
MKKIIKHSSGNSEQNFDDLPLQSPPAFTLYSHTHQATEYWFYISSTIREPSEYTDMIHTIRHAGADDMVFICLNTPGGRLDTGIQIVNALRSSDATIVAVLEAEASSMGAIIFLAADQHIVHENCRMMFHDFSGGGSSGAKGNEQFKELTAAIQLYNNLLKNVCVPFLTPDEVNQIIKGEDFWMDSDQINKRLKNIAKAKELADAPKPPKVKKTKTVVESKEAVLEATTV